MKIENFKFNFLLAYFKWCDSTIIIHNVSFADRNQESVFTVIKNEGILFTCTVHVCVYSQHENEGILSTCTANVLEITSN